jgi:hypothetical protein
MTKGNVVLTNNEIISALARKMASGDLSAGYVLPVIRKLSESEECLISDSELLEMLQHQSGEPVKELLEEIGATLHRKVLKYYDLKHSDSSIPLELAESLKDFPLNNISKWQEKRDILLELDKSFKYLSDYSFTLKCQAKIPKIQEKLRSALRFSDNTVDMLEWGHIFSRELFEKIIKNIPSENPMSHNYVDILKEQFDNDELNRRRKIILALDELPKALPKDIDDRLVLKILSVRYKSSYDKQEKKMLLDIICTWRTDSVIPVLNNLFNEPWAKERASIIFSLRFGEPDIRNWDGWLEWLNENSKNYRDFIDKKNEFTDKYSELIIALWYSTQEQQNPDIMEFIFELCDEKVGKVSADEFVENYSSMLEDDERDIILNIQSAKEEIEKSPTPVTPLSEKISEVVERSEPPPVAQVEKEKPKTEIPLPSLWQNHIQPFFAENWYMVAGIFMVIAGSSLLAFYTWDKHWLVPYTIMPFLLACFTAGLAGVGSWVEKRGKEFLSMAAMLRGAAIALLPVNFMAIALLSNDARVSHKVIIVPLMGLIYILLGGWGLRRWCSAMHQSLGKLLGITLLILNAQVIIGPLAKSFNNIESGGLNLILGTGFYLGFGVMAFAVIKFTKDILDKKMASEKRIPWFFGATLLVTFLQVFAWVHGSLGYLPEVYTYAPMVILTGGLVLLVEKRSLQLNDKSSMHEMESFLGFALIFVGVIMSMPSNGMRILSLELAGLIWMFQAFSRKHPLHYWISLTFITLGFASIALLKTSTGIWLPTGQWMPILGILISLFMSAFIYYADKSKNQLLREASCGMQTVILATSSVVTVLAQWHYASNSILTAVYLLLISGVFMWRAFRDQKLRWLHTAMLILALALPYMGCVDVMNKTLHGNSMVFGLAVLSILWLSVIAILKHPLLIKARSTVVFFYGVTALIAMIVRVLIQHGVPGNIFMDYTGPLLIAAALVFIAYYSRSLIPVTIAAFILIILFPELKSHFKEELDSLGWGTGFGSACTAFGLIIASFILRELKYLKNLGEGDSFLGKVPFSFRRFDHTLFTWPLIASAVFLLSKTDTITFVKNLMHKDYINYESLTNMPLKASLAVLITGFCWTLLGIYYRRHRQAATVGIHLGWIWVVIGISCGYFSLVQTPHWTVALLINALVIQSSYFVYRFWLQKKLSWVEELMTKQMLHVLRCSAWFLALICVASIIFLQPERLVLLCIFAAVQLIWHGVKSRNIFYGLCLYFLLFSNLLAWTNPGTENLFARLADNFKFAPTLYFLLGIQLVHIGFEFKKDFYKKLEPVMMPFMLLSSFFVVLLGVAGFADALYFSHLIGFEQILLLILIFITARAHASSPLALIGLLLLYLYINAFPENASMYDKIYMIVSPWKLSVLALVLVIMGQCGRVLHARFKRIFEGPFSQPFYYQPSLAYFFVPAVALAVVAALYQTFNPEFRSDPVQSLAPFISAVAIGCVAYFWHLKSIFWVAIAFWALGNIHMVRIYIGDSLLLGGLSHIHLVCLGFATTMLEASLLKMILRKKKISVALNRACLVIALIVLCMLSANYFVNPNLLDITWMRFAISGSMALIAGLYFRRAARRPGLGEENLLIQCEGFYHYGVSMTIWCLALMIPWFRTPATALFALGIPVLYFYFHAETKKKLNEEIAVRYRNSAATLSFIILSLYVFRFAFKMMLFPDSPIDLMHYHSSAPVIILLAFVMFRLHGLGGTLWLAFYGGIALMAGSYFSFCLFSKMSLFYYPINGVWCAIIFSHFWIFLSYKRSPIRSAIQRMAKINDESWHELRKFWGFFLILATQIAMLWGLGNCSSNTYMVAPLLVGGASILIHQGILKRSPFYYAVAAFELLFALHAGFLTPSWLPKEQVIWSIVILWGATLIIYEILQKKIELKKNAGNYMGFAVLLMLHVFYHGANSTVGLWAFAAGAVLAALTPCNSRSNSNAGKILPAALILLAPTWLIFFSQINENEFSSLLSASALLVTAASFFVTGILAKYYQIGLSSEYEKIERPNPRLFDRTLSWLGNSGSKVNIFMLCITLFLILAITLANYLKGLEAYSVVLILVLYLSSTVVWYIEGARLKKMLPYFIMQFCVFLAYVVLRRQIELALPDFWRHEYDIWATLIISSIVSGLLQLKLFNTREIRIPLTFTLCAMPILALVWTLSHHLGTNTLLQLVGLYSMIFVFMGKDDKESPYHIVAVSGFVAFLLILFWNKLEVRVIHAYIIPVGIGVLVLLQMFSERIKPQVRNQVRFITLMAMLGSSGYYVLIGSDINIIYVMIFGILGLFAMILGSILKIRLYLLLGFTGLIVDICVIFCKLVIKMQRNTQMTIVGSLVLVFGVAIVAGAIFYKTHREKIMEFIDNIRNKLQSWE